MNYHEHSRNQDLCVLSYTHTPSTEEERPSYSDCMQVSLMTLCHLAFFWRMKGARSMVVVFKTHINMKPLYCDHAKKKPLYNGSVMYLF